MTCFITCLISLGNLIEIMAPSRHMGTEDKAHVSVLLFHGQRNLQNHLKGWNSRLITECCIFKNLKTLWRLHQGKMMIFLESLIWNLPLLTSSPRTLTNTFCVDEHSKLFSYAHHGQPGSVLEQWWNFSGKWKDTYIFFSCSEAKWSLWELDF